MSFIFEVNEPTEEIKPVGNSLWVERYRPTTLSEYIGNDHLKGKVQQYLDSKDIPHLLLFGSAGTGKTTLAKLIVKSIPCDFIYINASDENSVDTVRNKIKSFASSMGFHDLKIVILDEADYLTASAQAALRNLMETYSAHTRFILTCNYQERIIDPIISRVQSFQVIPPNKKDVAVMLIRVLSTEKIQYEKEGVVTIIQSHYPDIRAVINTAQRAVIDGKLTIDKGAIIENDAKSKIVELLKLSDKKQAFRDIRQLLADNSIHDFSDFFTLLYEKVDEYAPHNASQIIVTIADGQFRDASVVDKEINFMATIIGIIKEIK